jgi:hypothetical protein
VRQDDQWVKAWDGTSGTHIKVLATNEVVAIIPLHPPHVADATADLIIALRNAVPDLLDYIDELEQQLRGIA